jgi:hypothetical protein
MMAAMAVGAAPASAESGQSETSSPAADTHCTFNIETTASKCFSSFREVIQYLSHGQVVPKQADRLTQDEAARVTTASAAMARSSGSVTAASTVTAVFYDNSGYGGSTLTATNSGGCDNFSDVDSQSLTPAFFNDRTSSFIGYSNCQVRIYENTNYSGASYYAGSTSYVGNAMNDRMSSQRFY